MHRRRRSSLVALSVLLVGAVGCGGEDAATTAESSTTIKASSPDGPAVGAPGTAVTTDGTSYTPARLVAKVGEAITFTNSGGSHSVTPDDPAGWTDGGATVDDWGKPDATYSTTFAEPGEYAYHCSVHGSAGGSGMSGVVIIE